MKKKSKKGVFSSIGEYNAYYAKKPSKKKGVNPYYKLGEDIAKAACDKAINSVEKLSI